MADETVLREKEYEPELYLEAERLLSKKHRSYFILKRLFDMIASCALLVLLSPFLLLIAALIKLNSKGPAIYAQTRVGLSGTEFTMYKFRSMCEDADVKLIKMRQLNEKDGPIFKIQNDPRITAVGRFLRKTSMDELPQLFNVLKGDMSLVGPRPPLVSEVEKYSTYEMQRLSVVPGLTCYWQISGRSDLSFEKWITLDIQYIRDCNFLTDLKILFKTIPAVLSCKGAY